MARAGTSRCLRSGPKWVNLARHAASIAMIYVVGTGFSACLPDNPKYRDGPLFAPAEAGHWNAPVSEPVRRALDETFTRATALGDTTALSISVKTRKSGVWQSASPGTSDRFWWASVGKLVTTILVLTEIETGRLGLDQTVELYLPDVPDGVTIRHLLNHTSGIPDFGQLGWMDGKFGLIDRHAMARAALASEPDFVSGVGWSYSNTGFLLLQEILENLNGISYAELVEKHIARPLGLKGFEALDDHVPADVTLPAIAVPRAASEYPPNIGGAGNVVATAGEMAAFWHAAMAEELVSNRVLQKALAKIHLMFGSEAMLMGAGMVVFQASDNHGYWLGHTGGADQVGALLLYSPDRQMVLAVAGIGPNVPALEISNLFIETIDKYEADGC